MLLREAEHSAHSRSPTKDLKKQLTLRGKLARMFCAIRMAWPKQYGHAKMLKLLGLTRSSQVVRRETANLLFVGSIPTSASKGW